MKNPSRRTVLLQHAAALSALLLGLAAPATQAQTYPNKPVQVIVPYSPGGGTDVWGRMVAQKLSERMKQQFVVVNKPGANGIIGTDFVAKAPADGYTLEFVSGAALTNTFYKTLPFDILKDMDNVGQTHVGAMFIFINASLPVNSLKELFEYSKKNPLSYASAGVTNKLAMEALKKQAGADIVEVPYKGSGDAAAALAGNQVQVSFDVFLAYKPLIDAGKVRAIAVASDQRFSLMPNLPTINESGYKGIKAVFSGGLWAPAGTPKAIIAAINKELVEIVKLPDVQERFRAGAAEPASSTAEGHRQFVLSEMEFWRSAASSVGYKPEN